MCDEVCDSACSNGVENCVSALVALKANTQFSTSLERTYTRLLQNLNFIPFFFYKDPRFHPSPAEASA